MIDIQSFPLPPETRMDIEEQTRKAFIRKYLGEGAEATEKAKRHIEISTQNINDNRHHTRHALIISNYSDISTDGNIRYFTKARNMQTNYKR